MNFLNGSLFIFAILLFVKLTFKVFPFSAEFFQIGINKSVAGFLYTRNAFIIMNFSQQFIQFTSFSALLCYHAYSVGGYTLSCYTKTLLGSRLYVDIVRVKSQAAAMLLCISGMNFASFGFSATIVISAFVT